MNTDYIFKNNFTVDCVPYLRRTYWVSRVSWAHLKLLIEKQLKLVHIKLNYAY